MIDNSGVINLPEANVILCGSALSHSNLGVGTDQSNAMIPVNGKPVIGWILDELLFKGIKQATVVLRDEDTQLQRFLQRAYVGRMNLSIAPLRKQGTIIESVQAGLIQAPTDCLTRIILGDTLIRDSFYSDEDFVYVGKVEDSRRWCLVVPGSDGTIADFIDKKELVNNPYMALAGYYHLCHGDYLRDCVEKSIAVGQQELSDVLRRYEVAYPLQTRHVREWFDFGHIDNLVDARRRLLQPRYFNSLSINPVLNTITKVSQHTQKLRDEIAWYRDIPEELKVLTPRIITHEAPDDNLQISQEYYGYPTLAELYVYGELHTDIWLSILRHVLRIHNEFRRYEGNIEPKHVRAMYIDKTWQRLSTLQEQDPYWADILVRENITFNGRTLRGVYSLQEEINSYAQLLAETAPISVIHGDFCFSNILFDLSNQIVRLIDPRGSFGCSGVYGDSRYDVAKLRHSVCELYDHIMADMFDVRGTATGLDAHIYVNENLHIVASDFDRMLSAIGYDVDEIRFIEGLLFVSMLPLHKGHLARQQLLYMTGLSLLNGVLCS